MRTDSSPGEGRARAYFVLGQGPTGVFGDVEVLVQGGPTTGGSVEWRADRTDDDELRTGIMLAAEEYLRRYAAAHPEIGLRIVILAASRDPARHNDYPRAIALALQEALIAARLPFPQIFADPAEDPTRHGV